MVLGQFVGCLSLFMGSFWVAFDCVLVVCGWFCMVLWVFFGFANGKPLNLLLSLVKIEDGEISGAQKHKRTVQR